MRQRVAAGVLLVAVGGMAAGARPPDAGALYRLIFVVSALSGAWAAWKLSTYEGLQLRHVVGLAIVCRLLLLPMLPSLSDDGYRYVWDGMLLAQHGLSPYAFHPSDSALAVHQLEPIFGKLNSLNYYSVYPPASQLVFALGGAVYASGWHISWYVIKLMFVTMEGIGISCLARVVSARGVALYALHPVALIEIAGQGHTEGALVCGIGLAILGIRRRPWVAGAALAFAGWVKLFPLAFAPLFARRWRFGLGWGIVFVFGLILLVPDNGLANVRESIALYGGTLDFYAAPFLLLKSVLYPVLGPDAGGWASRILAAVWLGGLVMLFATHDGADESLRRSLVFGVVSYALLSPMQHPWNWLGALYVLPLLQNRVSLFWIATISLMTYLRYVDWEIVYWIALLIGWGGGLILWLLAVRSSNQRGGGVGYQPEPE